MRRARSALCSHRGPPVGSFGAGEDDQSLLWSASSASSASSARVDETVHALYLNLRPRPGTSGEELLSYRDEEEAVISFDGIVDERDGSAPVHDVSLVLAPYSTPLIVRDTAGRVEPLEALRALLLDERNGALIGAHRTLFDRLHTHLPARRDRARLLRVLNHVRRHELDTLPYMRGCLHSPVTDFVVHGQARNCAQPLARVLYWLCRARESDADLLDTGLGARFELISRCQTPHCINPTHYEHAQRRRKRPLPLGPDVAPDLPLKLAPPTLVDLAVPLIGFGE